MSFKSQNFYIIIALGFFSSSAYGASPIDDFVQARSSMSRLQSYRQVQLSKKCAGGYEHCFEGWGLPGDNGMPNQIWDVAPSDDDWIFGETRKEIRISNRSLENITYLSSHRIYHRRMPDANSVLMPVPDPAFTFAGFEIGDSISVPAPQSSSEQTSHFDVAKILRQ